VPENRAAANARKAKFAAAHPEIVRARKRRWYLANRERVIAEEAVRRASKRGKARASVIEAYGGRCACPGCHVHHAELLTVDHVNGDGATDRKLLGTSSRDICERIVKAGFPPTFQLLCGSCNLAKGIDAACPLSGEEH
jgi:hypothetical protein